MNLAPPVPGDGPGVHVLIIGVSSYPYLANGLHEVGKTHGLGQLDSAAQTAAAVAEWVLSADTKFRQPVRSLRLLASPSEVELHPLLEHAAPATLENVKEALWQWREDAAKHPEGTTIFYFAGHGIQRARGDSFLLLEDFLEPPGTILQNAVDLGTVYNGMAEPDFPNLAQLQLYFIDACKSDIGDMRRFVDPSAASIWDLTIGGVDMRVAPIFYASAAGTTTFGAQIPGGISAFGRDFLECVRGGAADNIKGDAGRKAWSVTIGTLAQTLPKFVERYNRTVQGRPRTLVVDKFTKTDPVIATLREAPMVNCRLVFLPDGAHKVATLRFADAADNVQPIDDPLRNPHDFKTKAGGYIVSAKLVADHQSPYKDSARELVTVLPPETEVTVYLGDAE
ncbi:MAG: caspase family protein [Pseudomonadota bacterium]|nr:caspase family protein [Pseudomonadota bacterium]